MGRDSSAPFRKLPRKKPRTALTPQQELAATMLGTGSTQAQVAEALSIAPKTIWNWEQVPAFVALRRETTAQMAEKAREHFAANLQRASQVVTEAMAATKPIFRKEDDGEGRTALVPQEDVPDHAIRLKAVAMLMDRSGMNAKMTVETVDPQAAILAELARRFEQEDETPAEGA